VSHRLSLLGSWRLTHGGRELTVPAASQRLAALLALKGAHPRSYLADVLWPSSSTQQARANLRAALWRLRMTDRSVLGSDRGLLELSRTVVVDVHELIRHAMAVAGGSVYGDLGATASILLSSGDLLPGWYDDWVQTERERVRQLRLNALETLAEWFCQNGRHAQALDAALAAAQIDPLRENAHRTAIRTHLAEGNVAEAVRRFDQFQTLLRRELAASPSRRLQDLMRPFLPVS
jgi:DNA-binding SARP family transcriptional activator